MHYLETTTEIEQWLVSTRILLRTYIIRHIAMLAMDCAASVSVVLSLCPCESLVLVTLRIAMCCHLDADIHLTQSILHLNAISGPQVSCYIHHFSIVDM